MNKFKNTIFYTAVLGFFSFFIYAVISAGLQLEEGRNVAVVLSSRNQWQEFISSLTYNLGHPIALLLAQIVTIIIVARLLGWICTKIGQPTVIGEMIAGILLGPSLFGMYFPEFSAALFPRESLGNLQILSQIGLILFMFIVGMELDLKVLRTKAKDAVIISHASIIIPFALGIGLSYFVYSAFAPSGISFVSFGLFIGISMSITAFPVLARIVQERGIQKTRLGTIVITCAAADDITAWCLLAAVIAIVKAGTFVSALYVIALACLFVFFMIKVVRPFLKRIGDLYAHAEHISKPIVAVFFLVLILSAWATEVIGIHALFGAFMAGAIMPENIRFRSLFVEKVEDVAMVLLLPLFFVFTGLRTEIGLLNDIELWKTTGWIILVAVVGKFVGSAVAAKFVGQNWKDSLTIGALMNTRGLMELVILNIGYDLGVLSPEIFAMMVIMALVTTFMTGPSLDIINFLFKSKKDDSLEVSNVFQPEYRILLSFSDPEKGKHLFRLGSQFTRNEERKDVITAMNIISLDDMYHYDLETYEKESFAPIIQASKQDQQMLTTLFKVSNNIDTEIAEAANKGKYDLLLIGVGQSIFEGSLLGRILGFTTRVINPENIINQVTGREGLFEHASFDERTRTVLAKSKVPVGIFVDKNLKEIYSALIIMHCPKDVFLLTYVYRLAGNSNLKISLKDNDILRENISEQEKLNKLGIVLVVSDISSELLSNYDLVIMSLQSWEGLVEDKMDWLSDTPSTLIIEDK